MKHLIIGSGVIGKATGIWLHTNNEKVIFNDINEEVIEKIKTEYETTKKIINADIYWICTAEWDVENVLKTLDEDSTVIVRSTTSPGTMVSLQKKHKHLKLIHNPEFLVQNEATIGIFNPDRIILGSSNQKELRRIKNFYLRLIKCPVVTTDFTSSEMIKLTSNCWLATQISYWNEIKTMCDKLKINPQAVSEAVTLDKRISKYGSIMLGKPFAGFCLPKDTKAMKNLFNEHKIKSNVINATIKTNKEVGK